MPGIYPPRLPVTGCAPVCARRPGHLRCSTREWQNYAVGADIPGDIVPDCAVINLSGRMLCPGFTDQHVHLIGGGGEGPTTRRRKSP